MFYSQCILSRKGPLKHIWVAAFCQKKLDKQQVSNTDISSSVDEIILNEVTVSYRVLAYLLLGVVRIYSKKVEYLYHDCNEVLTKIKNCVPVKKLKEGMCAPYSSITLPERFELNDFDLELPEDINDGNVASHQNITLEEKLKNVGKKHYSSNKHYHELDLAHLEISDVYTPVQEVLSPYLLENYVVVHPSDYETFLEPGTEEFQENQFSREYFPNIEINFGSNESGELGTQCSKVDSRIELESILEVTPPDHGKSGSLREGDPLASTTDHGKSGVLREGDPLPSTTDETPNQGHAKSDEIPTVHGESGTLREGDPLASTADESPKRSRLPNDTDFGLNSGDDQPMEVRTPPNEVGNRGKRIKFLDITPLNHGKSAILNEVDTGASTPEFMDVSTPAKKEQPRFSRKRKHLLDDTIVLSNEVMKHSINDSSSLIAKRMKAPITALDVWKTHKLPYFYQDFMEPLIPRTALLNNLFRKTRAETPQLLESSEVPVEDRHDINRECLGDRAHSERNIVDYSACNSVGNPLTSKSNLEIHVNPVYPGEGDAENPVHPGEGDAGKPVHPGEGDAGNPVYPGEGDAENPVHPGEGDAGNPVYPGEDDAGNPVCPGEGDAPETEAQDIGLNLIDEDSTPCRDDNENQNAWSTRTRRVATFLCKRFLSQKEHKSDVLNLKPVIATRTRKENARLFYEVLVLKSQGFVEVKQESPYGDICLLSTPQLMTAI